MKRIILIGLVAVVAVAGAGVFFLYSSLNSIVKAAVEKVGSEVTGTQVVLNDVEISPTEGLGALRGFRLTNPQGFGDGDAFKFNEVKVLIDVTTVTSDPVVIKEVSIDGPEIGYVLGERSSNFEEIKKNVEGHAGGGQKAADDGSGSDGPKIVIENLYLRNGKVSASAPALSDKSLETPLPTIHLANIGKDNNGATPAEIAKQTVDAVLQSATAAVGKLDLGALGEEVEKAARQAEQAAAKAASEAEKAAGGAAKEAESAVKGAAESADKAIEDASGKLKKLFE
ncbi:MAG: hypothetical protein MI806_13890 [Minwuiales bacterium]|nr:hypothetical protein [Minwuiales bacterium]